MAHPKLFVAVVVPAVGGLGALAAWGIRSGDWAAVGVWSALIWCAFSGGSNLLPVPAGQHLYLSMSAPVNIAVASVFPTPVAAVLVSLASFSEFELTQTTTWSRALYNRAQLGLSAAAASAVLHLRPSPELWTVVAAVVCYHVANWTMVAVGVRAIQGRAMRDVVVGVLPKNVLTALTYLAVGGMGVALGLAYRRVGAWAAALLLIPLVGALQAVRAAHDIERTEHERRLLADQLIEERERERLRIATDLHNVVLQDLALLQVQADNVAVAAARGDGRTPELSQRLRQELDTAIADVRAAIANLRRSGVGTEGLVSAIERYAGAFGRQAGLNVAVEADRASREPLPAALTLVLYECCQELLTNVARHASATNVTVVLSRHGDEQELTVHDDGVGMPSASTAGQGLTITRARLESWGGAVLITTPESGTRVVVRVPLGSDRTGR